MTARRRKESLQDTPIAVTAFSADELRDRGITNTQELTKMVPSLEIADSQSNQIYIRGIGERTGFVRVDPAVGVYLDDLFISQQDNQLLDTVDVESIQVLRGPQGTLFGKNTTGGALVLSLVKPGDQLEGYTEVSAGIFGLVRTRAALNFPITEGFYTRLSVNAVRDDGYIKDVGTGDRNNSNDRQAALLQTRWDVSDAVVLDTLLFYGRTRERFNTVNCRVVSEDALFMRGLYLMRPGDTDPANPRAFRENCESNSRERLPDLRTDLGGTNNNYDKDITNYMLGTTLNWVFSADHTFKTILGVQDGDRGPLQLSDNDGGPAMFVESLSLEKKWSSASLEFQLNGALFDTRLNYTGGLFLMREKNGESSMGANSLAGLDLTTLLALANQQRPSQPPAGGTTPFVGTVINPLGLTEFDLESTTLAGYFQGSFDLTENLQFTLGLRYTEETRKAETVETSADADAIAERIEGPQITPGGVPVVFGPSAGGLHPCLAPCTWALDPVATAQNLFPDVNGDGFPDYPLDFDNPSHEKNEQTFTRFTPMLSLSYNVPDLWLRDSVIDSTLVYATWSNGFKAGFFEPLGVDGLQPVKQETVENREVGIKIDAFQRSLRINAALYSMVFDDMQLINVKTDSQGALAVNFDNAGKAKIEGGELEVTWLPFQGLMTNLSYSHNRYKFVKFEELDLFALTIEGRQETVDRSDEAFPISPERTFAFGIQYLWDTVAGTIIPRVDVSYKSKIFIGFDRGSFEAFRENTSLAGQKAYSLVDARLGWTNNEGNISAALFVKNLTDERYLQGAVSIGDSIGTFVQVLGEPRRYGVEFRFAF